MKFTSNPKGIRILLVVLIAVFASMVYCSARAEEGLAIGFGKASAGSDVCLDSMLISQSFGDWLGYLSTHGGGECRGETVEANIGAGIIRMAHLGRWSLGFGAGVLEHGDIIVGPDLAERSRDGGRIQTDIQFTAAIVLKRRIGRRLEVTILHNSTGGSTEHNRGLNTIVLAGRF